MSLVIRTVSAAVLGVMAGACVCSVAWPGWCCASDVLEGLTVRWLSCSALVRVFFVALSKLVLPGRVVSCLLFRRLVFVGGLFAVLLMGFLRIFWRAGGLLCFPGVLLWVRPSALALLLWCGTALLLFSRRARISMGSGFLVLLASVEIFGVALICPCVFVVAVGVQRVGSGVSFNVFGRAASVLFRVSFLGMLWSLSESSGAFSRVSACMAWGLACTSLVEGMLLLSGVGRSCVAVYVQGWLFCLSRSVSALGWRGWRLMSVLSVAWSGWAVTIFGVCFATVQADFPTVLRLIIAPVGVRARRRFIRFLCRARVFRRVFFVRAVELSMAGGAWLFCSLVLCGVTIWLASFWWRDFAPWVVGWRFGNLAVCVWWLLVVGAFWSGLSVPAWCGCLFLRGSFGLGFSSFARSVVLLVRGLPRWAVSSSFPGLGAVFLRERLVGVLVRLL
ncbi:hypothetical protein [Kaistia granuli]|uniref:hypothetical protein n=1 Tax=Kaistia granuli TaxID=363259 RepID=UPI0012EC3B0D|nr:hypothetical protein [Kaistia granuli]